MSAWRLLTLVCATSILVETKSYNKREAQVNLCDETHISEVQCYCYKHNVQETIRSADCYLTNENVKPEDNIWKSFVNLESSKQILFTNTRGITLKYIPTNAFQYTKQLSKVIIKYSDLNSIPPYSFGNMSTVEEITLRGNQIANLSTNAFASHPKLQLLSLDENKLHEINRDVFVNLPLLEKLFLTDNEINTIHDRAFIHLTNLKELEIDRNNLYSLNPESFVGLQQLKRLDLHANSLEVIGDNTFAPLSNLRSLNLESNKIEVIDSKAFSGLTNLESLSLARNKLTVLSNDKIFLGLNSLKSLNLQGNHMRELKFEVIQPILQHFYKLYSSLDVDDNDFPCACKLDWFLDLMNNTKNNVTKLALYNLKCEPDDGLREAYNKTVNDKEKAEELSEDLSPNDEDYYDETQLGGKLFYIDIRHLLNCNATNTRSQGLQNENSPTRSYQFTTLIPESTSSFIPTKVTNQGVLDLSLEDMTTKTTNNPHSYTKDRNSVNQDEQNDLYTTTRLATVSAKPKVNYSDMAEITRKNKYDDNDMASDEAQPESTKGHKRDYPIDKMPSSMSHKSNNSAFLLLLALVCKLFF